MLLRFTLIFLLVFANSSIISAADFNSSTLNTGNQANLDASSNLLVDDIISNEIGNVVTNADQVGQINFIDAYAGFGFGGNLVIDGNIGSQDLRINSINFNFPGSQLNINGSIYTSAGINANADGRGALKIFYVTVGNNPDYIQKIYSEIGSPSLYSSLDILDIEMHNDRNGGEIIFYNNVHTKGFRIQDYTKVTIANENGSPENELGALTMDQDAQFFVNSNISVDSFQSENTNVVGIGVDYDVENSNLYNGGALASRIKTLGNASLNLLNSASNNMIFDFDYSSAQDVEVGTGKEYLFLESGTLDFKVDGSASQVANGIISAVEVQDSSTFVNAIVQRGNGAGYASNTNNLYVTHQIDDAAINNIPDPTDAQMVKSIISSLPSNVGYNTPLSVVRDQLIATGDYGSLSSLKEDSGSSIQRTSLKSIQEVHHIISNRNRMLNIGSNYKIDRQPIKEIVSRPIEPVVKDVKKKGMYQKIKTFTRVIKRNIYSYSLGDYTDYNKHLKQDKVKNTKNTKNNRISPKTEDVNIHLLKDSNNYRFIPKQKQKKKAQNKNGFSSGNNYSGTNSGVWGQFFGGVGEQDYRKGEKGYDSRIAGFVFGIDSIKRDYVHDRINGLSISHSVSNVNSKSSNRQKTEISNYSLSLYNNVGKVGGLGFYNENIVSVGYNEYSSNRYISLINGYANSEYSGVQYGVKTTIGNNILAFPKIVISPNLSLEYSMLDQDDYKETGVGNLGLDVSSNNFKNLSSEVGVRISRTPNPYRKLNILPEFNISWLHNIIQDGKRSSYTFISGGSPINGDGEDIPSNMINVGLGVTFLGDEYKSLELKYDLQAGSKYVGHIAYVKYRLSF